MSWHQASHTKDRPFCCPEHSFSLFLVTHTQSSLVPLILAACIKPNLKMKCSGTSSSRSGASCQNRRFKMMKHMSKRTPPKSLLPQGADKLNCTTDRMYHCLTLFITCMCQCMSQIAKLKQHAAITMSISGIISGQNIPHAAAPPGSATKQTMSCSSPGTCLCDLGPAQVGRHSCLGQCIQQLELSSLDDAPEQILTNMRMLDMHIHNEVTRAGNTSCTCSILSVVHQAQWGRDRTCATSEDR